MKGPRLGTIVHSFGGYRRLSLARRAQWQSPCPASDAARYRTPKAAIPEPARRSLHGRLRRWTSSTFGPVVGCSSSPLAALVNTDLFFGLQHVREIRIGDLEALLFGHPLPAGGNRHRTGVICVMAAPGSKIPRTASN